MDLRISRPLMFVMKFSAMQNSLIEFHGVQPGMPTSCHHIPHSTWNSDQINPTSVCFSAEVIAWVAND